MPELEDPFAGWRSNRLSEWDLSLVLVRINMARLQLSISLLKFPHDVTMAGSFWSMLASGQSAMTGSLHDRLT